MDEKFQPLTFRLALLQARPRSWAAAVLPSLFGICYCKVMGYGLPWWKGILLLAACVLFQSAVNSLNDYFDFVKGTDTEDDTLEADDAVLLYHHLNPESIKRLAIGFLAVGTVFGLICCIGAGWAPILIGLIGFITVILYSGGPLPISYLPIGELMSGLIMGGLIPLGIAACADGRVHWDILIYSIPLIISIGLIMMSNNGCDIEKDIEAGRRTLPVLLKRPATLFLYRMLLLLWNLLIVVLPIVALGPIGLVSSLLLVLLAGRKMISLAKLRLEPEGRILQMKTIGMLNYIANAAYVTAFAVWILKEAFHG